ncbi:hypothetical protein LCGC14_3084780, partial [marine sediment metagenome]
MAVRIYESVLSDDEISWLYNSGDGRNELESGSSSGESWIDTSKVIIQDDNDAYVSFSASTENTSLWLQLAGFGFNIPTGAVINGIEVLIDKQATQSSSIKDGGLLLRKTSGRVGIDKADTVNYWDITDNDFYNGYGGQTDLWGITWTVDEINSADFGIDLYVEYFGSVATDARIDHVIIKIHYTDGGTDARSPQTTAYSNRAIIDGFNNTGSSLTTDNIDRGGVNTGWVTTGTGTTVPRSGSASSNWNNPVRIESDDGSYASESLYNIGYTDWLRATNFDMGVPAGATIDGIVVEIDDMDQYDKMGLKNHNPAGAVAWKFGSLTAETTLLD